MAIEVALSPWSAPVLGVSQTAFEAVLSVTRLMTMSACAAACLGVVATVAPLAASGLVGFGERFHTVSGNPAARRLAAMREPMAPRPRIATD